MKSVLDAIFDVALFLLLALAGLLAGVLVIALNILVYGGALALAVGVVYVVWRALGG